MIIYKFYEIDVELTCEQTITVYHGCFKRHKRLMAEIYAVQIGLHKVCFSVKLIWITGQARNQKLYVNK